MKLRNQILRAFLLLGLLPLLVVLYGMMFYSEHLFLRNVDEDTLRETQRVGNLIKEEIHERVLLLNALSETAPFHYFGQSLSTVLEQGELNEEFSQHLTSLQYLLSSIQPLVAEDAVIRILDPAGRTIVKVRFGSTSHPIFENLQPYEIIENEPSQEVVSHLESLPAGQVSFIELPGSNIDFAPLPNLALMDAIRPVQTEASRLYLTYSSRGERLNRLLRSMPRFRDAKISIGTRNPAQILFDDTSGLPIGGFPQFPSPPPLYFHLTSGAAAASNGVIVSHDTRFYFTEIFPFPDHLNSWVISAEVDQDLLLDFFKPLRWGVAVFTLTLLLLGLILGSIVSKRIAAPVSRLAGNMKSFAKGEATRPDIASRTNEIRQLQMAFSSMTDGLQKAESDKVKAEKQLAQAERLASIGEMAAGIGHELNNPLNNILSLGKLMKQAGSDSEDFEEDLDDMMAEARRASKIVSGVLSFARQVPPEYIEFDVEEWLHTCVSRVSNLAEEHKIELLTQIQEPIRVSADPRQLEQVLINLLTNAIQASPPGSTVEASAKIEDEQLLLQVVDEGTGMSEDTEAHLFEPFYTTKTVGQGSGLGLSISLGIIESHHGSLQLKNRQPKGVIAEMRIPREPV